MTKDIHKSKILPLSGGFLASDKPLDHGLFALGTMTIPNNQKVIQVWNPWLYVKTTVAYLDQVKDNEFHFKRRVTIVGFYIGVMNGTFQILEKSGGAGAAGGIAVAAMNHYHTEITEWKLNGFRPNLAEPGDSFEDYALKKAQQLNTDLVQRYLLFLLAIQDFAKTSVEQLEGADVSADFKPAEMELSRLERLEKSEVILPSGRRAPSFEEATKCTTRGKRLRSFARKNNLKSIDLTFRITPTLIQ